MSVKIIKNLLVISEKVRNRESEKLDVPSVNDVRTNSLLTADMKRSGSSLHGSLEATMKFPESCLEYAWKLFIIV